MSSSPAPDRATVLVWLERAFAAMRDAVLLADDERRYVFANPAACELLDLPRHELLGKRIDDFMPVPPGVDLSASWRAFFERGHDEGEFRLVGSKGNEVTVEYRATANIAPGVHLSVLRDVTERARARAELAAKTALIEERERQFSRLADSLPFVIARLDPEGRHLYVNEAIARATGRRPEEMIGRTNRELGGPEEVLRTWEGGTARALAGEAVRLSFDFRDPEGSLCSYASHLIPERGPDGAVACVLVVAQDVTAEKRAHLERLELLRKAEEAKAVIEALVTGAPIGFAVLDRDLRFQLVNDHLAGINGLPIEAHLGKNPMELFPGLPAQFTIENGRRVLAEGKPLLDLELIGETPAMPGQRRTWLEHWYPVRVGDETVGVGIVVSEVTEARRLEEFRERLLAIVSHDLRSPLQAISMGAALLSRGESVTNEKRISFASRIVSSAARMKNMIDQLLDWARIQKLGGLPVQRAPIDLLDLASAVRDELLLGTPGRKISVTAEGDVVGEWDADRLGQALANLLANALQHGAGDVQVELAGDGGWVTIAVVNQGEAIPAQSLRRIFEPFKTATEARPQGGLGLGLFITNEIARAHGGTVTVTSNAAATRFVLRLPR